jgi:hypothetical protein
MMLRRLVELGARTPIPTLVVFASSWLALKTSLDHREVETNMPMKITLTTTFEATKKALKCAVVALLGRVILP